MNGFWKRFRKKKDQASHSKKAEFPFEKVDIEKSSLYHDLKTNLHNIKKDLGNSPDIVAREFEAGGNPKIRVAAIYMDGLADKKMVSDFILHSLMVDSVGESFEKMATDKNVFHFIKHNALTIGEVKVIQDWNQLMQSVLSGDTVILIDGWAKAISGNTRGGESRSVTEPTSELVIRGPKDGFSESLGTNISLVRRRIQSPNLWLETMKIGKVTKTDIGIMYIKGIVNDQLVQEVKQRLNDIEIDSILESGYIEELIQDQTFTPFPTVFNTERPDVVAGNLVEGRIAILVAGTPFVLIVPTVFAQFFQSAEDYYQRFDISIVVRVLRYLSFIVALIGPSIYIAAITFHQEMIPTPLLISVAAQREGVPFPAFIEAMLMEASFEVMREAGVRMPRAVGQAVSIVGALIIGQAAVQAGIVSAAMVIVVAATGIASFTTPAYSLAIAARLLRFLFMILAGAFGFFGLTLGMIMLIAHLASLRSFGIPYLAPFAPLIPSDQKDAVLRLPLWSLFARPRLISQKKTTRMKRDVELYPSEKKKQTKGDQNEN
ncbi:spore germination protein [Ammoniphilus sp. 3BR4]|uniref:spore germination protein n=1 Tax=Ammoniphilus sp. 3BR4 TaxID=3158265 RepID=UPI0034663AF3